MIISTLCFTRSLFPDSEFAVRAFEGVSVSILKPNTDNPRAQKLVRWLENGVFPALDRGYIDRVLFNIHDADPARAEAVVIESYSFRVSTAGAGESGLRVTATTRATGSRGNATRTTRGEVSKNVRQILKQFIVLTTSLDALPDERWISMQLTYTPETPSDFEPQYFQPAQAFQLPRFLGDPLSMPIGRLETPFHAMVMKLRLAAAEEDMMVEDTHVGMDDAPAPVHTDGYLTSDVDDDGEDDDEFDADDDGDDVDNDDELGNGNIADNDSVKVAEPSPKDDDMDSDASSVFDLAEQPKQDKPSKRVTRAQAKKGKDKGKGKHSGTDADKDQHKDTKTTAGTKTAPKSKTKTEQPTPSNNLSAPKLGLVHGKTLGSKPPRRSPSQSVSANTNANANANANANRAPSTTKPHHTDSGTRTTRWAQHKEQLLNQAERIARQEGVTNAGASFRKKKSLDAILASRPELQEVKENPALLAEFMDHLSLSSRTEPSDAVLRELPAALNTKLDARSDVDALPDESDAQNLSQDSMFSCAENANPNRKRKVSMVRDPVHLKVVAPPPAKLSKGAAGEPLGTPLGRRALGVAAPSGRGVLRPPNMRRYGSRKTTFSRR